jgi:DNA-3-methyladenine glycosylase II
MSFHPKYPSIHPGKGPARNRAVIPKPLTPEKILEAVAYLETRDADLAHLFSGAGPPPMWKREPGFPTLLRIVLEQQVSLSSARAAFRKLKETTHPLTPERFLQCSDGKLKKAGFSRQKATYCRELARSIVKGQLNLPGLKTMDDFMARSRLMVVKGVGPWTADIYLLRALLRPDVWPEADLALAKAVQELKGLPFRPQPDELERIARAWRPWRAVAARALWQFYLHGRGQETRPV